jgi:hypothetical protein
MMIIDDCLRLDVEYRHFINAGQVLSYRKQFAVAGHAIA